MKYLLNYLLFGVVVIVIISVALPDPDIKHTSTYTQDVIERACAEQAQEVIQENYMKYSDDKLGKLYEEEYESCMNYYKELIHF